MILLCSAILYPHMFSCQSQLPGFSVHMVNPKLPFCWLIESRRKTSNLRKVRHFKSVRSQAYSPPLQSKIILIVPAPNSSNYLLFKHGTSYLSMAKRHSPSWVQSGICRQQGQWVYVLLLSHLPGR